MTEQPLAIPSVDPVSALLKWILLIVAVVCFALLGWATILTYRDAPPQPHAFTDARGAIIGFTDAHTRAHLYRAILEGIAYSLREGKERIEKRAKVKVTTLRVSGGGSQSDAAMQATADIFNLPASRPHTFETSGLGAAIACSVGLGLHRDFGTAVAAMTRIGRTFEPDAGRAALYERLYTGVYARMYERLQPLYAELHAALDR